MRKQTCDLITLLEMAAPLSHYYLFMEDDFRCAIAEGSWLDPSSQLQLLSAGCMQFCSTGCATPLTAGA